MLKHTQHIPHHIDEKYNLKRDTDTATIIVLHLVEVTDGANQQGPIYSSSILLLPCVIKLYTFFLNNKSSFIRTTSLYRLTGSCISKKCVILSY